MSAFWSRIAGVALLLTAQAAAQAQPGNYPNRPVTLVVTMAPGGTTDIIGRQIAQQLQEKMGGSFVVENRPGAGGNIGSQYVARAPADGYTLMVQLSSTHVINPALYKTTGFDPVRDFVAVTPLVKVPYVLIVNAKSDINSVRDLLNKARSSTRPVQYGSAGNGTPNHLLGELLGAMAGIKFEHVPYKGAAPATQAVAAGEVPFAFGAVPTVMGQIKGGMVRAIGVSSPDAIATLPNVAPIAQSVPNFSGDAWVGLFAPAGTPPALTEKLNAEVRKIMAGAEFRERLLGMGAIPFTLSSAEFTSLIRTELPIWADTVKRAGATVD